MKNLTSAKLPNGWQTKRLKFVVTCNDETLGEHTDSDFEFEYVDISSVELELGIKQTETLTFDKAPSRARRIVRDGDTLVSTVRTYLKAVATVCNPPSNLIASTGFAVLRPGLELDAGYLGYFARSEGFISEVVANSTGVSYPATNPSDILRLSISFPALPEQRAIAAFLDARTAHLDGLIRRKEDLLKLLAEQRAALITRTVTRGLDATAPLKDSGVPWLGQVPAHWEVKRLKFITTKIGSGKTPRGGADVYVSEGVTFLRSQNIHFDGLELSDVVFIEASVDEEMSSTRVKANDVLLNITGASLGRVAMADAELGPANVNQHVCIIRPDLGEIDSVFLWKFLASPVGQSQIFQNEQGISRDALNFDQISNLGICVPPLTEQRELVEHLASLEKPITALVKKIELHIARLREYRSALITAAVTGRIDVRGAATGAVPEPVA